MDTLNDFSKGMQSDVSKLIQARNTYLEAINFRPFTELGGSNTSLVTIKGNSCGVKFPTMRDIYKIKLNIRRPFTFTDTIDIDITGTWGTDSINAFVVNSSTTIDTLYNAIILLPNYGTEYTAAYKDDYIMIYQRTTTADCVDDVNDFSVSITENMVPGTQNTIWFIGPNNSFFSSGTTLWPDGTPYIAAPVDPLIPIGYTTILEDIYLFVAVDNPAYTDMYSTGVGVPVNDDYSEPGYIFRLQYDETSNTTTLTLVYGAYINLTKYASIPPSASIGRYESDQIQRIYWSDFYNKVKTLNVTDPMVMATNPLLTGLQPSVHYDIPIMKAILSGGSLNVGTYEVCYRLKQTLGAITGYSTLSNMVHLIAQDNSDFKNYEGSVPGTNSGYGIRYEVANIDTAFDRIEIVLTFRDSKTDICKVYSVKEDNIPSTGIYTIDIMSLASADEILLSDFLAIQSSFTHAKTVDTKDNRLFWGNVKVKTAALASWDSRAFRAKTTGTVPGFNDDDVKLINNGVLSTYTWTNAAALPETYDTINEYYDNVGVHSANACYYQPGAAYIGGLPVLGGKGANISYKFGTKSIQLNNLLGTLSTSNNDYSFYNTEPYRFTSVSSGTNTLLNPTNDSANQIYPWSGVDGHKNPYQTSLTKGYQHEEIYRFAFQPYDLEGTPYFSKWIGDIKFPAYGDPNVNVDAVAAAAGINDFRLSFVGTDGYIYGQILYIEFNVDVSAIADSISGYRIVRMERDSDTNKTILGCGMISPTYAETGATQTDCHLPANFHFDAVPFPVAGVHPLFPLGYVAAFINKYNTYPSELINETLSFSGAATALHANNQKVKTFDCFDFVSKGGRSGSPGDKIFIRDKIYSRNYAILGGVTQGWRKWFDNPTWYDLSSLYLSVPNNVNPGFNAYNGGGKFQSGCDEQASNPYYMHMYVTDPGYGARNGVATLTNNIIPLDSAPWVAGNTASAALTSGLTFKNYGRTYGSPPASGGWTGNGEDHRPCVGTDTMCLDISSNPYADYSAPYNCNDTNAGKLIALYYRPNITQYGGNTYSARAGNEYVAAGSYIPVRRNNLVLTNNANNAKTFTYKVFGGDVHTAYWDLQKAIKNSDDGTQLPPYYYSYNYDNVVSPNNPGHALGNASQAEYRISVTHFFPCTTQDNVEVRFGDHVNTSCTFATYQVADVNLYATYHSNESNIVKYFSKPLDFVETNKWINRVYYSEVKYNNETKDSWQVYKTNNFYDVEGNYGAINALVAFRENLYYIQERGFGILYVNPMTAVTSDNNIPVVLGLGATIQRHNYLKLDVGTMHQWSVFRSPDNIAFIDSRHKCLYMFNGQSLEPVSDIKGQRNFFVKRFHPEIILRDNPIINKGVHTTYDYYHKEFLITFNNASNSGDQEFYNENYTLVYSEPIDAFSSLYTCTPKTYFNNNRYILSFDNSKNIDGIYIHNVGYYGTFYDTETPSSIKVLVNEHPNYTKVFDNISFATESIDDQVEWIDEIITPTSNSQTYSDNINKLTDTFNAVRCYNEYQNSDWVTLTNNTNVKKREQSWHVAVPRNAVQYDTLVPSTSTIFDPLVLTKTTGFRERLRDKYLVVDLRYDNTNSYRFIVHNLKTTYRMSAR